MHNFDKFFKAAFVKDMIETREERNLIKRLCEKNPGLQEEKLGEIRQLTAGVRKLGIKQYIYLAFG